VAIIQSILTQLNTKIDSIVKNTERINEIPPINTSNCLICSSVNLKVIATKRKKKGLTYRTCVCIDCGSINKQVIETISVKQNNKIFTAKNDKIKKILKPFILTINNKKLSMQMEKNSNFLSRLYDTLTPTLKEYTISMFQKDYDRGMFMEAENSLDPVEIRFIHKHDAKRNLTYLFLKYLGVDTKNVKNLKVITTYKVVYKQSSINEGSFYMNIKNITFITEKK